MLLQNIWYTHTHTQAESDFLPFLWMSDKMSMDALPFVEFWNVQSRILRLKLSPTVVDRPTQLICISDIYLLTEMFWPVNIYICSICNIRISWMCGIWTQSLESQEEQLNICPAPDAVFVELAELAHQHLNIQSIPVVSQSLNIWKWNILTLSRTRGAAFPIFQVAAAAVF